VGFVPIKRQRLTLSIEAHRHPGDAIPSYQRRIVRREVAAHPQLVRVKQLHAQASFPAQAVQPDFKIIARSQAVAKNGGMGQVQRGEPQGMSWPSGISNRK
jgi:hypothetical protein